jgi:hypothetical protein
MLTFKSFLREMSWDNYLYHMTSKKFKPEQIKPWSHLGSLRAAMGIGQMGRHGRPNIFAYKFKPKGKGVAITDKGGDPEDQLDDMFKELIRKKHIPEPRGWRPKRNDDYWSWKGSPQDMHPRLKQAYIEKYLKKQGITHLYYKNSVEDPGSRSFIVLDPEKALKPVHTFKGPFKYKKRNTDFTDTLSNAWWGGGGRRKVKFPIKSSPTTAEFPYKYSGEKKKRGRYWNAKEASSLRKRGWTYKALGKRYGVTASAVWMALNV